MSGQDSQREGIADAAHARAELYTTLSQLKVQLNYAQRIDNALEEAKLRLAQEHRRNPVAFAAGVAGVAALAGLAVWGVAARIADRLR
ncbi:hypothetical protein [Leucobacter sp. USHLN153]|uniref:hypothetical protein n=1 Tax=Leucobacter sp. USHLN153 TaxID=3081268 RepID=UPI003017C00F